MSNSESKVCQNCKGEFTIDAEDFHFYEKMQVPPPTWCPDCRAMRRMMFWNEHHLFRKKEIREGKEVFSTYPEHAPNKIYAHDYWWGDGWGGMQYEREFDPKRPFLEQFRELMYEVPWPSRAARGLLNSDYCNMCSYLKNCYLCFNCENAEDCLYGVGFQKAKNCIDFYWCLQVELSYELAFCDSMYESFFCVDSYGCRNTWFSLDCGDCSDCFGCVGLRHKKYHIFNQPYTKEEYEAKIKEFNLGSYTSLTALKNKAEAFWLTFPRKYMHGVNNTDVVGDYVEHSKHVRMTFQGDTMENVRYSQNLGFDIKDAYDYTNWGQKSELIYECSNVGDDCRNIKFCYDCWPGCERLEYSMNCHSSADCFGCFGLKKKKYAILNKQYSPEDYKKLREIIVKQMNDMPYVVRVTGDMGQGTREIVYRYGEFFPPSFSALAYQETITPDYYPLTKDQAVQYGFAWHESAVPHAKDALPATGLPDHINDATHDLVNRLIACVACERPYHIIDTEFVFYKRFGLPLPRLCPKCRHEARAQFRNPLKWQIRKCDCKGLMANGIGLPAGQAGKKEYKNTAKHSHGATQCPNEFETTYAPDRPEIVYCESCYNSKVA